MPTLLIANTTEDIRAVLTESLRQTGRAPELLFLDISPATLKDLINNTLPQSHSRQEIIRHHLLELNFSQKHKGFQLLCAAIPLFAQDPEQLLIKEVYPAIASTFHCSHVHVESAIRRAIKDAWLSSSPEIWHRYFPGCKAAPTNKQFICTLAQMLK